MVHFAKIVDISQILPSVSLTDISIYLFVHSIIYFDILTTELTERERKSRWIL